MPNHTFNPANAVGAGNTQIGVYFPWKLNEMMAILSQMPDIKLPTSFVDFLRTTMQDYNANYRDLFVLVQQVLTPVEHARFLANLGCPTHDAPANLLAQSTAREDATLATLSTTAKTH